VPEDRVACVEMGRQQLARDDRTGWFSTGAAMLLHVKVTVYPLTTAAGRV
jgi:hypothetical protein